jgi:hypothetical protein
MHIKLGSTVKMCTTNLFFCLQAESDCQTLGVTMLAGPGPESLTKRPLKFAEQLVDMATKVGQNIAKTPALMAQRQQAEERLLWMRYALLGAAVLGGLALVYSVATSTDGRQEGTAKDTKKASVDQAPAVRVAPQDAQGSEPQWKWPWQL